MMPTFISAGLLLGILAAFALETESAEQTYSTHANLSCTPYETQCALGCCPYAQAECCSDGYECCQHGQTCIPYIGICIGIETKKKMKDAILVSSNATPLRSLITPCPSGTTTCGPGKCCLFPNANCCEDGEHCCPYGYRCDLPHKRCLKDSDSNVVLDESSFLSMKKSIEPQKTFNKPFLKSCPGGYRQCPSYFSCCINDEGDWGCCPNPSLNMFTKGNGECCSTVYGFVCCPDVAPHCTMWGCRP